LKRSHWGRSQQGGVESRWVEVWKNFFDPVQFGESWGRGSRKTTTGGGGDMPWEKKVRKQRRLSKEEGRVRDTEREFTKWGPGLTPNRLNSVRPRGEAEGHRDDW